MKVLRLAYKLFGTISFALILMDLRHIIDIPGGLFILLCLILAISIGVFFYLQRKQSSASTDDGN
ncbi:hypothetical protein CHL76_08600 [Marinococcus halophilus]|uniref:hypothetical protein n=1 Tax=Marinococcus halophilus TaxID=1371 RepID=UPI0009A800FB|nr:hypothetical protein [Marinococcus halophilus]OZT80156.1 hypothetical protein CHL76_08600 [Marinococcus halophilus]